MAESIATERGCEYHANFIYNRPKLRYQSNGDCETSLEIVKFAVNMMASWGYDRTYYHDRDALPGSNIFDEFFKTVKLSRFTVVVITKGFVNDSWSKYKSQAAFCKLLEKERSNRFIAFYINIDESDIPDMLCIKGALQFDSNWRNNSEEWGKLRKLLTHLARPIQDTGRDPVVTSRQNYSATTPRQDGRQQIRDSEIQRNPTSGVQDSSAPEPTMLRGSDLATDSSDTSPSLDQAIQQGDISPVLSVNQLRQQGDNSQSLGFSVNGASQNTDGHTEILYQREHGSGNFSTSNNSPVIQLGSINRSSDVATLIPVNTGDVNRPAQPIPASANVIDNRANSPLVVPDGSEVIDETSTRPPVETRSAQGRSEDIAILTRLPPDGETSSASPSPVNVQRVQSTDTNPKDLVGEDDEDRISSLDRHDVEEDTTQQNTAQMQTQNIKHGKTLPWVSDDIISDQQGIQLVRQKDEFLNRPSGLDSPPMLDPRSMEEVKSPSSNDLKSIGYKRNENNQEQDVLADSLDEYSFRSRMYSLVTNSGIKFLFNTVIDKFNRCDQI